MKALVLSGGSGTRLRPLSYSMPKQLMPVANRPVLEYVLENIRALGISDVGVVVGEWEAEVAAAIGDGSRLGVNVTYIRQKRPLGLAHCVLVARGFLGDDNFVMYLGDNMLSEGVAGPAAEFAARQPVAQVTVHKVANPRDFGVAELDAAGAVVRLVEKPGQPRSDLALMGVYFFTPAIHEAVSAIEPSARGELEITDAMQWLVARGANVIAREYEGYWADVGGIESLLDCNSKMLDALRPGVAGDVDTASVLSDLVVIDRGARVMRSRIDGPAIIGAGCVVEDSHVGPYTSVGRGCVLRGAQLDRSILFDGVTVTYAGALRNSVLGRSAVVGSAKDTGTRHSLILGDHARVEVAA